MEITYGQNKGEIEKNRDRVVMKKEMKQRFIMMKYLIKICCLLI